MVCAWAAPQGAKQTSGTVCDRCYSTDLAARLSASHVMTVTTTRDSPAYGFVSTMQPSHAAWSWSSAAFDGVPHLAGDGLDRLRESTRLGGTEHGGLRLIKE